MASLLSVPAPPSVLVVAAHPDDIEFMAGGTLTAWAAHGSRLHYLLVTDGAGGSRDPRWTRTALAAARRSEQRRAAAILGAASVTFLGRQDATLEANDALRLDIARVIRQIRPAAVLTFDPHLFYRAQTINHFDHVAVGVATLGAVMRQHAAGRAGTGRRRPGAARRRGHLSVRAGRTDALDAALSRAA